MKTPKNIEPTPCYTQHYLLQEDVLGLWIWLVFFLTYSENHFFNTITSFINPKSSRVLTLLFICHFWMIYRLRLPLTRENSTRSYPSAGDYFQILILKVKSYDILGKSDSSFGLSSDYFNYAVTRLSCRMCRMMPRDRLAVEW